MSASDETISCSCGQVIFNTDGRKTGEKIVCPWCNKRYRYLGGTVIHPIGDDEPDSQATIVVRETQPRADEPAPRKIASPRKAVRSTREPIANGDAPRKPARKEEVPGGVLLMIVFMAVFNGLAFGTLAFAFPEISHGVRQTPWGDPIHIASPWPELLAMISGQLLGFVGWAICVHRLYLQRQAAQAKAEDEKKEKPSDKEKSAERS